MVFDVLEVWYRAGDGDGEIVLVTILNNNSGPTNYDHDENRYHALVVDGFRWEEKWCFTSVPKAVKSGERSQGFVGYRVTTEPEDMLGLVVALGSGAEETVQIQLSP